MNPNRSEWKPILARLLAILLAGAVPPAAIAADEPGADARVRGVYINEIMYAPSPSLGDPDDYQWVEIYNATREPIRTTGWRLNDFVFPESHLPPNGYLIVARQDRSDPDLDGEYYSRYYNRQHGFPHLDVMVIDARGADLGLGDGPRNDVWLRDREGRERDHVVYGPHLGGYYNGSSLEKIVSFFETADPYWRSSVPPDRYGTAGLQNSTIAVHMKVESNASTFVAGDTLRLRTRIANRTKYPTFGILRTFMKQPGDEGDRVLESGLPFDLAPFDTVSIAQEWPVPGMSEGDYLVKQVTGDVQYSLTAELVEFVLGTQDLPGSGGESSAPD